MDNNKNSGGKSAMDQSNYSTNDLAYSTTDSSSNNADRGNVEQATEILPQPDEIGIEIGTGTDNWGPSSSRSSKDGKLGEPTSGNLPPASTGAAAAAKPTKIAGRPIRDHSIGIPQHLNRPGVSAIIENYFPQQQEGPSPVIANLPTPSSGPDDVSPNSPRWTRSAAGMPIPIPPRSKKRGGRGGEGSPYAQSITGRDSLKNPVAVPSSWKTIPTPSSWESSYLNNDECSLQEAEDSDKDTEASSGAGLSYARRRRLRDRSKASITSKGSRAWSHAKKERWTKKLEDFREFEVSIFRSRLPLKAAFGASLAYCMCFAPFLPELLKFYGTVAVVGVGMTLDSTVGLTLQKGYNMLIGSALAALCALIVTLVEPYTGSFKAYYLITCVFLGGTLPRLISLPTFIKTHWSQTLTFHITIFHGFILNESLKMEYTGQFFIIFTCYATGFLVTLFFTFFVRPDYAGDSLLVLLVSDFHTAGVVLERIVEDYKTGHVLTKIHEILSGEVTEDHIHYDLQYIMKSTEELEKQMNAVRWEPSRGKFFPGYPWDLYPTLLDMLVQVVHDLIALDSALRAEIQAPLDVRLFFAEDMEILARECSMLFHKLGDALFEHQKIDYHVNVQRAKFATLNLRKKLVKHSLAIISQDFLQFPISGSLTRESSRNSLKDGLDELRLDPSPPPSPECLERTIEQDAETAQKLNQIEEDIWQQKFLSRKRSITDHWEETQQQISSLSFVKFASILMEFMSKVKIVVKMVDQISVKARFKDLPP